MAVTSLDEMKQSIKVWECIFHTTKVLVLEVVEHCLFHLPNPYLLFVVGGMSIHQLASKTLVQVEEETRKKRPIPIPNQACQGHKTIKRHIARRKLLGVFQ